MVRGIFLVGCYKLPSWKCHVLHGQAIDDSVPHVPLSGSSGMPYSVMI